MTPAVGDRMPETSRRITLTDMVVYAGATWDWHRMHYDYEFARIRGLPAPIVDGQMFGALLVKALQDWLGPVCFVEQLDFTFRNLMFPGEEITIGGVVREVAGAKVTVDLTVTIGASEYGAERPAVAPASAVVWTDRIDGVVP
jgi:Uncharacterized conserved protein